MTNIEKLRGMTDRAMAICFATHCGCPPGDDPAFHGYKCNIDVLGCVNCWDKWLHREAEESEA